MNLNTKVRAVIWDYDGTLVDTRQKNLQVTKKIMERITGKNAQEFSALRSVEAYDLANKKSTNWRELYKTEYGLAGEQIDRAGRLWTGYQIKDNTPVQFYGGIPEILDSFKNLPQGIVSQNSKSSISKALKDKELLEHFRVIVGYEEVAFNRQKPEPDGLIMCAEELAEFEPGLVFYIGDHEADIQCALNANEVCKGNGRDITFLSIGAFYGTGHDASSWRVKPDYTARSTGEILKVIGRFL